jgi:LmbE family N-acetylglucosaminyl deacetylase
VYEATANRDAIVRGLTEARAAGMDMPNDLDPDAMDGFGVREDQITTAVDVTDYLDRKRAAMAAHASQISETSFFLSVSPEFFARAFGTEWFIRRGAPAGIHEHGLLDGLD